MRGEIVTMESLSKVLESGRGEFKALKDVNLSLRGIV